MPGWRRLDRARFGGETQELSVDAKFKLPVRHSKGDDKKAVTYEPRALKKYPTKDKKFGVISIEMILKIMERITSSRERVKT